MKPTMKTLLTAVVMTLLTATAMAQERIPDNLLREHNESCVAKCAETRSYAFCAETCACMSGEMKRHWTTDDYATRSSKISKESNDRTLRDELSRMANYCAERSRQAAQQ